MMNFFPKSGIFTWEATPLHPRSHRKTKEETMTGYTPTTGTVCARYCDSIARGETLDYHAPNVLPEEHEKNHAEFRRWLAEEIRKAKAEAWEEGYRSGHSRAMRRMSDEPQVPDATNPYTEKS